MGRHDTGRRPSVCNKVWQPLSRYLAGSPSSKLPRPQIAHDCRAVPDVGGGVELAPLLGQLLREGRADEAACAARGAGTGEGARR